MKRKNNLLIFSVTLLIILILVFIYSAPLNKETISTKFLGGKNMGFDLSPGSLNFGLIPVEGTAARDITIINNYKHPTLTKIKSSGEISPYIIVSENNFILQPNELKNITFTLSGTQNIEVDREYSGEITIITKRTNLFS